MVSRRTFLVRAFAGGMVAALPAGHVAAALAETAEPEPINLAPGVDVLDGAHWNTVEQYSIDDPRSTPTPPESWDAVGYFFVHDRHTGRATQRQILLKGHVDGSMRIAFCATSSFDQLRVGRGLTAIYLAPDLAGEVWKGLFATSDHDVQPTAPFERQPWDDERYLEGQQRIHRMQRYSRTENVLEGGDEGVYTWFHPKPLNAA